MVLGANEQVIQTIANRASAVSGRGLKEGEFLTEKSESETLDIIVSCRFQISLYSGGIFTAGGILFLILAIPPQANFSFWVLSISWIISVIIFTLWRFTRIKKLYVLKVKGQDRGGIKLLILTEYLGVILLFSWLLVWFGFRIGSEINTIIYMATIAPFVLSGFYLIFFIGDVMRI